MVSGKSAPRSCRRCERCFRTHQRHKAGGNSFVTQGICIFVTAFSTRPPGEMASRLTTIALSGDCRFDPCGGHMFCLFCLDAINPAKVGICRDQCGASQAYVASNILPTYLYTDRNPMYHARYCYEIFQTRGNSKQFLENSEVTVYLAGRIACATGHLS